MRNRIPTNVRNGRQAIGARVAGYGMPCAWSLAEITVAKRSTVFTKDHGKRPEEAPTG
jgi:hypothetical protein